MPNFGDLFGGSNIKSIQRGVISMPLNADAQSVAITPVNPAFCELRLLGVAGATVAPGAPVQANGYIALTGGGTAVTATSHRQGYSDFTRILSWELTEFYPS